MQAARSVPCLSLESRQNLGILLEESDESVPCLSLESRRKRDAATLSRAAGVRGPADGRGGGRSRGGRGGAARHALAVELAADALTVCASNGRRTFAVILVPNFGVSSCFVEPQEAFGRQKN